MRAICASRSQAARGVTERLRLPTGKDVDVKIPAGIADGQQIRLKGQGMPGQGGAGDALIEMIQRTANGRLTAAEALGHREFVLTKLYRSA